MPAYDPRQNPSIRPRWPAKAPVIRWRSQGCLPSLVIDFLAERIEPAANTETLSESALYTGYASWCRASGREALSAAEFVDGFDRLRAENGLGKIRKWKGSYAGIWRRSPHETHATRSLLRRRALSRLVAAGRDMSGRDAAGRALTRQRRDRIKRGKGSLGLVLRRTVGAPVTRRRLTCVRLTQGKRITVLSAQRSAP